MVGELPLAIHPDGEELLNQDIVSNIVQVLDEFPQVRIGYVYGSAARDRMTGASDVDVAVAAESPLDLETRLDIAVRLSQTLHREIDLIDLNAVSGDILRRSMCDGTKVLQKDANLHARLVKRLWFEQADMMPYIRRIRAERRRRFLHG